MKRALCLAAFLLSALPAFAQSYPSFAQITNSQPIEDGAGNAILSGTITFTPYADAHGTPIYPTVNGGGRIVPRPVTFKIAAGVMSASFGTMQLVDVTQANPQNFCYTDSIHDNGTGATWIADTCVQPAWDANWCTYSGGVTTCDFSLFVQPTQPATAQVYLGPGINWRGTFDGASTYALHDAVLYNGSSYVSLANGNTQTPPGTNWNMIAEGVVGNLSIGTVTQTPYNTLPTASVTGTPPNFVLNYTFPAAQPVAAASNKGAWSGATTYSVGDLVAYGGFSYLSLVSSNLNHQPDVSPTYWTEIVSLNNLPVAFAAQSLANPQAAYFSTATATQYNVGGSCPGGVSQPPTTTDPQACSMSSYVLSPSTLWNSWVVNGNGGGSTSHTGTNPIDPLTSESNGSFNGYYNYFSGANAGLNNTTGNGNLFIGQSAGWKNVNGDQNVFLGWFAGEQNIDGYHNFYGGVGACQACQHGFYNVVIGTDAALNGGNFSNSVIIGNAAGGQNQGNSNTFVGQNSGLVNTTGAANNFIGTFAGISNTTGSENTFDGEATGVANTTGSYNSFFGRAAGQANTTGYQNTFGGRDSGFSNVIGFDNDFSGFQSGYFSTANGNTFHGSWAGYGNTTGASNTAEGAYAGKNLGSANNVTLIGNSAGEYLTATGAVAVGTGAGAGTTLVSNSGTYFTAVGQASFNLNSTGTENTGLGAQSCPANTDGYLNTCLGAQAGLTQVHDYANTFVGAEAGKNNNGASNNSFGGALAGRANTTGGNNTFWGASAGLLNTTGANNFFGGAFAGAANLTGTANAYVGQGAGQSATGSENALFGQGAGTTITTGAQNTTIGRIAGGANLTTGSGNVLIGRGSDVTAGSENNTIGIGLGATTSATAPVKIQSTGQPGITISTAAPAGSDHNGSLWINAGSSTLAGMINLYVNGSWVSMASAGSQTTGGVSTAATFYPLFVASNTSGMGALNTTAAFNFNPSTGVLASTSFTGAGTGLTGSAASLSIGGNAATATKWASARTLAGNSVDGSANVAFANKFIVQGTADTGLSGAQFLGSLGTGIVKNTTTTGVLSIAAAGDFPTLNQSTTGSAAALSISGQTGLLTFTGLTSTNRVKTVRDAADTILELGGSYTPTGTWTSMTLVTPALGTPASGLITNLTGTCSGCTANSATNIAAGTVDAIPYQTGAGATGFVTAPTAANTFQVPGWKPNGSAAAPAAVNVTALQFNNGFFYATTAAQAFVQNKIIVQSFTLPVAIYVSRIAYGVQTADNTANNYDIGIYSLNAAGTTASLVLSAGATAGTTFAPATGFQSVAFTSPTLLTPGTYLIGYTTSCASTCAALDAAYSSTAPTLYKTASGYNTTSGGSLSSSGSISIATNAGSINSAGFMLY